MSQKYKDTYDWKKLKRERSLARADLRAKMREAQASKIKTEQETLEAGMRRQEG